MKPFRKLFAPVILSPGLLGAQNCLTSDADSGSKRLAGTALLANGVRVTAPVPGLNCVEKGSQIVRRVPSMLSDLEKSPPASAAVGTVLAERCGDPAFQKS